ncbi:hypothetical protein BX600DRAFT_506438 [Xylariales sp. PMI_506]|nr:hypothetical protein BX600DRAFT_506438 [Xylariales sp. PMI_506]
MAPELRSRKRAASAPKSAEKPKAATPASKRKAADEASPIATKKTKPSKVDSTTKKEPKASKPSPKASKPAEPTKDAEEDASSDEDVNDQALVLAGVSDSEDESQVDESVAFKEGQDVGKVPKVSQAIEKAAKASKGSNEGAGVVYIGRIPHGFYEHEMRQYFTQFGDITRLRLSRNKKTGQSKHYAFIEFAEESTAEIVAKTMHNYLLFGHLLKCRMIPKSQVHESLFKGANKRFKRIPHNKIAGNNLKKPLSEDKWAAKISKTTQKRADQAKKLKEIGYEFDAPELKAAVAPPQVEALEADVKEDQPKAIEAAPAVENKTPKSAKKGSAATAPAATIEEKPAETSKTNGAKGGKKAKQPAKSGKKSKA